MTPEALSHSLWALLFTEIDTLSSGKESGQSLVDDRCACECVTERRRTVNPTQQLIGFSARFLKGASEQETCNCKGSGGCDHDENDGLVGSGQGTCDAIDHKEMTGPKEQSAKEVPPQSHQPPAGKKRSKNAVTTPCAQV